METTGFFKIAFILLIMFSCQTDTFLVDDARLTETSLTGSWEWVSTDGGIANHIHETPASTGREEEWVFSKDMRYLKYVNGVLTSKGSYSLTKRKCIHDQKEKWLINFSSSEELMIERMDAQSLELSDENYDGMGRQFKRIE